jgi:uncharacterized RDD family membrane protein YckC
MPNPGDINPYSAPKADLDLGVKLDSTGGELASPWARLGAAFVNLLFLGIAFLPPILFGARLAWRARSRSVAPPFADFSDHSTLFLILFTLIAGAQVILLSTRGQSLGKILFKIRIVTLDGRPAGFLRGFLLRSLLAFIIGVSSSLGRLYLIVNVLFIFRDERRCLHDFIAGTRVVKV